MTTRTRYIALFIISRSSSWGSAVSIRRSIPVASCSVVADVAIRLGTWSPSQRP
jgi:hypothetical protein